MMGSGKLGPALAMDRTHVMQGLEPNQLAHASAPIWARCSASCQCFRGLFSTLLQLPKCRLSLLVVSRHVHAWCAAWTGLLSAYVFYVVLEVAGRAYLVATPDYYQNDSTGSTRSS